MKRILQKAVKQTQYFSAVYLLIFLIDNILEWLLARNTIPFTSLTGVKITVFDTQQRILSNFQIGLPALLTYLILLCIWLAIYFRFFYQKDIPDILDIFNLFIQK